MKLDTFFRTLAKLKKTREWRLYNGAAIRTGKHCPLSIMAGVRPCCWDDAGLKLGLRYSTSVKLMRAADSRSNYGYVGRLRRRMLKALGLKDPS